MTEITMFALGIIMALFFVSYDVTPAEIKYAQTTCESNGGLRTMTMEFGDVIAVACNNGAAFRKKGVK